MATETHETMIKAARDAHESAKVEHDRLARRRDELQATATKIEGAVQKAAADVDAAHRRHAHADDLAGVQAAQTRLDQLQAQAGATASALAIIEGDVAAAAERVEQCRIGAEGAVQAPVSERLHQEAAALLEQIPTALIAASVLLQRRAELIQRHGSECSLFQPPPPTSIQQITDATLAALHYRFNTLNVRDDNQYELDRVLMHLLSLGAPADLQSVQAKLAALNVKA